jgi:hypothetical protein
MREVRAWSGAVGGNVAGGLFGELAGAAQLGFESELNPPNAHLASLGQLGLPNAHNYLDTGPSLLGSSLALWSR